MQTLRIIGEIDQQHRLVVCVPRSFPSGSVEVLLIARPDGDDDAGLQWMNGISQEWEGEMNDPREDIYSLTDGTAADEPR